MAVDTSVIGAKTGAWRVTVERAPIANFARVLQDANPGLADTPAPPIPVSDEPDMRRGLSSLDKPYSGIIPPRCQYLVGVLTSSPHVGRP